MKQCGAITYDGGICKRMATSNGRCHWHGGLRSPADTSPAPHNGGKWTTVLPDYLRARYQNTTNDPDRLSVQGEIALIDARIEDLLSRLSSGESGAAWEELNDAYFQMRTAAAQGLYEEERSQRFRLGNIIADAVDASTSWVNIVALIEQRRRLVECEQRTAVIAAVQQRRQDAAAVIDAYTTAIQQHVSDPETCTAIHAEADRLLGP